MQTFLQRLHPAHFPADRRPHVLALVILLATYGWLVWHGAQHGFLPFDVDNGETVVAQYQAVLFDQQGFRYGLIENHGKAEEPLLYTHNVNIGALLFTALHAGGLKPLWAKQLITAGVFCVSLFYVFLCVLRFTRSPMAAIIVLLLFCTDFFHVLAFGMNALRAWHFLPLFGLLYHVLRLHESRGLRGAWPHGLALLLLSGAAFGCGYDFWIICAVAAITAAAALGLRPQLGWRFVPRFAWLATCLVAPFLARQAQIAGVLGTDYWRQDFVYSVAIKVPGAAEQIAIPPMEEIDAYYTSHHILRPPALPESNVGNITGLLTSLLEAVTVPTWGLVTLCTFAIGAVAAWAVVMRKRESAGFTKTHRAAVLIAALAAATLLGLAALSPFSLHVYLKHQFPLLAAPLLVAKGIVLAWGLRTAARIRARQIIMAAVGFSVAVAIIGDWVAVNVDNGRYARPIDMAWLDDLPKLDDEEEVLISCHVPPHLDKIDARLAAVSSRARYVEAGQAIEMADYLSEGGEPPEGFANEAVTASGQVYWIYQPADQWSLFDHGRANRRGDYLSRLILSMHDRLVPPEYGVARSWIAPFTCRAGSSMYLGVELNEGMASLADLFIVATPVDAGLQPMPKQKPRIRASGSIDLASVISQEQGTIQFWYTLPSDLPDGLLKLDLSAADRAGRLHTIQSFTITIDHAAAENLLADTPPNPLGRPQPDVEELVRRYPRLRIAGRGAQGTGYVAFAARHWEPAAQTAARPAPDGTERRAD